MTRIIMPAWSCGLASAWLDGGSSSETVVAEVGYLLDSKLGSRAEAAFHRAIADGDYEIADLTPEDHLRMADLIERYQDLRLGTTDRLGDRSR